MSHPLGRLAVLHPYPSSLVALLVSALVLVAGGPPLRALALGLAMVGFQVSIGSLNDLVDAPGDATSKPSKPIPAGIVRPRFAAAAAAAGASLGIVLSAAFGLEVLLAAVAGYACGVAYDVRLKDAGLGWLCFAVAFPLLLVYAWLGAGAGLPPRWQVILPVAALAGPALHLANGLVDIDGDRATGSHGLAVRLGRRNSLWLLGLLTAGVYLLAWLSLGAAKGGTPGSADPRPAPALLMAAATVLAGTGVLLSSRPTPREREWGWSLQAAAIAGLAIAWLVVAAPPSR